MRPRVSSAADETADPRAARAATAAPAKPNVRSFDDDEDEEEEEARFPLFVRVLLAVVLALVLFLAGIYFFLPEGNSGIIGSLNGVKNSVNNTVNRLTGLISPTEAPPQVLSFSCASPSGTVGSKCLFNMTTTQNVTGVGLCDQNGDRIASAVTKSNSEGETNRIWELTVSFDMPYTGKVFASIQQGNNVWITSDKSVDIAYTVPQPTATPAPTATPFVEPTPVPTPEIEATAPPAAMLIVPTAEPPAAELMPDEPEDPEYAEPDAEPDDGEEAPESTDDPEENEPTAAPEATPTVQPEPTLAPTDTPEPTATPAPTTPPTPSPSPMPSLVASSEASSLAMEEGVYIGTQVQKNYQRAKSITAVNPDNYAYWPGGVLTFRGDSFRRNASFGTVEVAKDQLSVLWEKDLGSLKTQDSGTVYGLGWTGQPAIVKWSAEVRQMMNLNETKKNVSALREVIVSSQDGKVYFVDLTDGQETREPISIGYPLKGSVSVNTRGQPMISFGQGISKLANGKQGSIGFYLCNLLDSSQLMFINGRAKTGSKTTQSQYGTNGAFDGSSLMLWNSDAMVIAGENGLLYTVDLKTNFGLDGNLTIDPETVYLKSKAKKANEKRVSVESSVAMYDKYVFMADNYGALRCVDTDTMKTVWAFDTGDNTDAAIALDFDENGKLWLYTGNTNFARLGSKKNVSIRRINAM
ncbi:MAG: hypothetical protein IJ240_00545, partial [Clostridia bacterium]|nr:hypothetical protein [Clostridia bacterium]